MMQPCAHPTCGRVSRHRFCDAHARPKLTRETATTILVCGPAGSGKSAFVREHMRDGDLIVDVDALACALSGSEIYRDNPESLPYALMARDAVLRGLARPGRTQRAWVVTGLPRRDRRNEMRDQLNAYVVVLETPYDECIRRIESDPRRGNPGGVWNGRVQQWWNDYRPSDEDERINA